MSVQVQYRHNHYGPNYIVYISKNVTCFWNIFRQWSVESVNAESVDTEGWCDWIDTDLASSSGENYLVKFYNWSFGVTQEYWWPFW